MSVADSKSTPADPFGFDAVELDFTGKTHANIDVDRTRDALREGHFVWADIDIRDREASKNFLESLDLISALVIEDIFFGEHGTQLKRYEDYLHFVLSTCRVSADGKLEVDRLDAIFGKGFMLTVHEGARPLLDGVRRDCKHDFLQFAETPSFLLYELWDHLTDHYVSVQKQLERRVEKLQVALLGARDEAIFEPISEVGVSLLQFRSVLVPARAILNELATRRTVFISEATQGFMANMAGTIEVVLQDLLVDRDSLTQALNLTMSMVSHRTSRAMTKLTLLSTIFLPLTFICGVYGMNFEHLPELRWTYGYLMFWGLCASIVGLALVLVRRSRLF